MKTILIICLMLLLSCHATKRITQVDTKTDKALETKTESVIKKDVVSNNDLNKNTKTTIVEETYVASNDSALESFISNNTPNDNNTGDSKPKPKLLKKTTTTIEENIVDKGKVVDNTQSKEDRKSVV
jgi:hypothetical protein